MGCLYCVEMCNIKATVNQGYEWCLRTFSRLRENVGEIEICLVPYGGKVGWMGLKSGRGTENGGI